MVSVWTLNRQAVTNISFERCSKHTHTHSRLKKPTTFLQKTSGPLFFAIHVRMESYHVFMLMIPDLIQLILISFYGCLIRKIHRYQPSPKTAMAWKGRMRGILALALLVPVLAEVSQWGQQCWCFHVSGLVIYPSFKGELFPPNFVYSLRVLLRETLYIARLHICIEIFNQYLVINVGG